MKYFYKIDELGKAQIGTINDGFEIQEGFTEYIIGQEPQELIDGLAFKTLDEIKISMESAIQIYVDSQAQLLGYDGIVSACSYAGYTNEFQAEAVSLGVWRSAVWTKAYQVQADVMSGTIPIPTENELILMLPIFGA